MAAAPIVFSLSPLQLAACIVVTFAAIALTYLLGLDEGGIRGVRRGRAPEREASREQQQERLRRRWVSEGHKS